MQEEANTWGCGRGRKAGFRVGVSVETLVGAGVWSAVVVMIIIVRIWWLLFLEILSVRYGWVGLSYYYYCYQYYGFGDVVIGEMMSLRYGWVELLYYYCCYQYYGLGEVFICEIIGDESEVMIERDCHVIIIIIIIRLWR